MGNRELTLLMNHESWFCLCSDDFVNSFSADVLIKAWKKKPCKHWS